MKKTYVVYAVYRNFLPEHETVYQNLAECETEELLYVHMRHGFLAVYDRKRTAAAGS